MAQAQADSPRRPFLVSRRRLLLPLILVGVVILPPRLPSRFRWTTTVRPAAGQPPARPAVIA
jgi:hypothetical protein